MNSMRKYINDERGAADSKAPTVVLIIILLIVAVLAIKLIPVKVRSMKFNNELQEMLQPNLTKAERITQEIVIKRIQTKARELGLPDLKPEKNIILKQLPEGNRFSVTVRYQEVISFPLYGNYIWPFEFKAVQMR